MSSSTVSVIGVGRLGLCLALLLESVGYKVHAIDKNKEYVKELSSCNYKTSEPRVMELLQTQHNITWHDSLSLDAVDDSSIIFILVDTSYRSVEVPYDCCHVDSVLASLAKLGVKDKYIVINSTVFPKYCESKLTDLPSGCQLVYSPEFIAQGDIINGLLNPDMVLIGCCSDDAKQAIKTVYTRVCANTPRICCMDLTSAEITKLAVNTFLTMKISYANYIGDLATAAGVNGDHILEAVGSDTRIGPKYLRAGFGYGGPCLVRDNEALNSFAKLCDIIPVLGMATDEYNEFHTRLQITRILHDQEPRQYAFEGSVCYKNNSASIENSQQLRIARALLKAGKSIYVVDREEVITMLQKDPDFIENDNNVIYMVRK